MCRVNDGIDRLAQQLGDFAHFAPVIRLLIKLPAKLRTRLVLSAAEQTHRVEQFLRVEVIADNFAFFADIDHVEGMNPIPIVNTHTVVDIFENENHTGR